jgi:pimeloyl-ACP methyl ester carboxylesterase
VPSHETATAPRFALWVTAMLLIAGCASEGATVASPSVVPPQQVVASTTTSSPPTAGSSSATVPALSMFTGDPFFDPGKAKPGAPGTILRIRPLATPLKNASAWQFLYWSRTPQDRPVAVSATVVAPATAAPGGSARPVLAYAHPTTGLGDQCAPSAQIASGHAVELLLFPLALKQGWTVVETDYQGLGTPGDHAYLIGQSEGRNVLDSVRAAETIAGSGANAASKVVVWGHSQGGGAAAFTAELQPTYAPDVDLVGAIAGAPAAGFDPTGFGISKPAYGGFVPMVLVGLRAGYPDLDADAALTAEGRRELTEVSGMCTSEALATFKGTDTSELLNTDLLAQPAWQAVFDANRAGDRPTGVPLFIYHGAADDLVSPASSAALLARYCAHGVMASRKVYPGKDHVTVVEAALDDIFGYAKARLAGLRPPDDCR